MTRFTQDIFISHGHIDNQPLTPDAFKPSSGPSSYRPCSKQQPSMPHSYWRALCKPYDIPAGNNDLNLYSTGGFPCPFKLCTD